MVRPIDATHFFYFSNTEKKNFIAVQVPLKTVNVMQ